MFTKAKNIWDWEMIRKHFLIILKSSLRSLMITWRVLATMWYGCNLMSEKDICYVRSNNTWTNIPGSERKARCDHRLIVKWDGLSDSLMHLYNWKLHKISLLELVRISNFRPNRQFEAQGTRLSEQSRGELQKSYIKVCFRTNKIIDGTGKTIRSFSSYYNFTFRIPNK